MNALQLVMMKSPPFGPERCPDSLSATGIRACANRLWNTTAPVSAAFVISRVRAWGLLRTRIRRHHKRHRQRFEHACVP